MQIMSYLLLLLPFFFLQVFFFLIMIDRIIYLCSFATGKVISYLFSLFLFTYSTTKYACGMQPSHQHAGKFALRAIYLTKAISLALQAIQIRHGLPHKSTLYRQFLTSSVSKVNFLCFRLYRALPFLYELRCVLDWSCTTTSLTMYDWLKVTYWNYLRKFLQKIWSFSYFFSYEIHAQVCTPTICMRIFFHQLKERFAKWVSIDVGVFMSSRNWFLLHILPIFSL